MKGTDKKITFRGIFLGGGGGGRFRVGRNLAAVISHGPFFTSLLLDLFAHISEGQGIGGAEGGGNTYNMPKNAKETTFQQKTLLHPAQVWKTNWTRDA